MKEILCIIPARLGSKAIKRKNFVKVGGKKLIQYTIDFAKKFERQIEILISSDYEGIKNICNNNNLKFYGLRPKKLSKDTTETIDVLKYEIKKIKKKFKYLLLLQPTCPIRDVKKVKLAITKIKQKKIDSVVSVCDVNQYHPLRMKKIKNGMLVNYIKQKKENMIPRQKLPKIYIRSGAIYLTKINKLLKNNSIVSGKVFPIITQGEENINIDTFQDLLIFREIIK